MLCEHKEVGMARVVRRQTKKLALVLILACLRSIFKNLSFTYRLSAEPQLLISSSEGIFHVSFGINASTPPELKPLELNTVNPSGIQCDVDRGYIYWAEENEQNVRILRANVSELKKGAEVVISWGRKGRRLQAYLTAIS